MATCQPGDLWQLGRHRMLCADSTHLTHLYRLLGNATVDMVFADPPYGIGVVSKQGRIGKSSRCYKKVAGDEDTRTATTAYRLYLSLFPDAVQAWWGANYYANSVSNSRCWLIWDKQNGGTSFADAELAWTNITTSVRIFRHTWNGAVRASERGTRYHPTQKPIALAAWFYEKYGSPGDLVLDPFLGSGPSLLAAEQTGRRCYGFEIDPDYCDVILARYTAASGDQATLLERSA